MYTGKASMQGDTEKCDKSNEPASPSLRKSRKVSHMYFFDPTKSGQRATHNYTKRWIDFVALLH
jgi:hypothetical protein